MGVPLTGDLAKQYEQIMKAYKEMPSEAKDIASMIVVDVIRESDLKIIVEGKVVKEKVEEYAKKYNVDVEVAKARAERILSELVESLKQMIFTVSNMLPIRVRYKPSPKELELIKRFRKK